MSHNSPTRHILEIVKRGLTMMAMALRWFVVVGFAVDRSKNFSFSARSKKSKEIIISQHRVSQSQRRELYHWH